MPQLRDKVPDEVGDASSVNILAESRRGRYCSSWVNWEPFPSCGGNVHEFHEWNPIHPILYHHSGCLRIAALRQAAWLGSFSLSLPPRLAWPQQSDQPQNIYVEKTAVLVGLWAWAILLGAQLVVSWVDSYIPKWPTLKPFQRSSSGWNLKAAPLHSFVGRRTAHFGSSGIGSSQCLCPSDLTAGIHQVVVAKIHKGLPTNRPA